MDDSDNDNLLLYSVTSLVNLAADVVGQNLACRDIDLLLERILQSNEAWSLSVGDVLWKKIAEYSFPKCKKQLEPFIGLSKEGDKDIWSLAETQLVKDRVKEMQMIGFTAKATITPDASGKNDLEVNLTFEKQQITSADCSCCQTPGWCEHVLTAVLFHIRKPEQVKRYATLTNMLSALDNKDLQKLIICSAAKYPFLERCMSIIEQLQDKDSTISKANGAPDLTEGFVHTEDRITEMGKKQFLAALSATNTDIENFGYDWMKKKHSTFQLSINKILLFAKVGNFKDAMDLFTSVLKELVNKMQSIHKDREKYHVVAHRLHDISHTIALCLLHPSFPAHLKERLQHDAQMMEEAIQIHQVNCVFHSTDTGLPHLAQACAKLHSPENALRNQKQKLVMDLQFQCFGEIFATKFVEPWSEELHRLTSGDVTWKESQYNENVALMLWRVESILVTEETSEQHKILRILPLILRKLTMMTRNMSPLSRNIDLATWEHMFDMDHNIPALCGREYASCPKRIKIRKLDQDAFESPLVQSEVTYGLLYCLYLKETCEKSTGKEFSTLETDMPFYWLALEMSSLRLNQPLYDTEHDLLGKMEDMVLQKLKDHYSCSLVVKPNDCLYRYLNTFANNIHNLAHIYLLCQLLSALMSIIMKKNLYLVVDNLNVSECVVNIGFHSIQRCQYALSSGELQGMSNVVKNQVSLDSVIEAFFKCVHPEKNKEWLKQTISSLADIFGKTELVDTKKSFKAFKEQEFNIHKDIDLAKSVLSLAVSAYKRGVLDDAMDVICNLAPTLGLDCLCSIINMVDPILHNGKVTDFSPRHVAQILMKLESHISTCESPNALVLAAMNYCFRDVAFPMTKLLAFYELPCFKHSHFLDIVESLMMQTKPVPSSVLFTVAKRFHENKEEQELTDNYREFGRSPLCTFDIIDKAFKMLNQEDSMGHDVPEQLLWVYRQMTAMGTDRPDGFHNLLEMIKDNGSSHPKIIELLLEGEFVDMTYIGEDDKSVLAVTYTKALEVKLCTMIVNIRSSRYVGVVEELIKAGDYMRQFGEEHKEKLKSLVMILQNKFRRKRLLSQMLGELYNDL